jgi:hypothetical protein
LFSIYFEFDDIQINIKNNFNIFLNKKYYFEFDDIKNNFNIFFLKK